MKGSTILRLNKKDAGNYLRQKCRGMGEQNVHTKTFDGLQVLDMSEDEHAVPRWS